MIMCKLIITYATNFFTLQLLADVHFGDFDAAKFNLPD